ncbi:MAG: cupin domain-containing protein [Bryobacterales bacterium]
MQRRRLFVAAFAVSVAVLSLWPGGRERAALVGGKLTGAVSRPWSQVFVELAPWSWRPRVRAWLGPPAEPWVVSLGEIQPPDGRVVLFEAPTAATLLLNCHLSVLPGGETPPPPHVHDEEELLIPLEGEADILRGATFDSPDLDTERVGPEDVVYHAARLPHTIRAADDGAARYLVLRWLGRGRAGAQAGPGRTLDLRPEWAALGSDTAAQSKRVLMDEPTASLPRLHVHITRLGPGEGSPEHVDAHDTVLLLLEGRIETLDRVVDAPSVVFNPAHRAHSIRNAAAGTARYLVVELDTGA